jgi:opacity protein-like surface antigen
MRRSIPVIGGVLLFAMIASAQDAPKMETFLGYTYVRFNSATNVPAFSANGGGGQFVYNFNKWIGAVADLGAVHNGNIGGVNLDSTAATFLFGPRVSMHHGRIRPYVQVLFGGVFAATSHRIQVIPVTSAVLAGGPILVDPSTAITTRIGADQTAFAMTAGGGLDIKITKHVSFRPIGVDYLLTRLQNYRSLDDNNQNNLRYTAGFNFTFGAR